MEEKRNIHYGAAMNYGLLMGLAMILFSFLTKSAHATNPMGGTSVFVGFLGIFFYFYGIYYFSKRFRTRHLDGYMTYGMGLKFGTLVILFASIIVGFYNYIDSTFIDPGLIERSIKESKELMAQMYYKLGRPESEIETMVNTLDKNPITPAQLAYNTVLSNVVMGFIVSLITAGVLRKKPNPFEQNTSNNSETN